MASLTPSPKMQFFDANGNPLAGGKLYTYAAGGTSTPQATYTDYGGGTPNANPVILDSRGEASVWLGSSSYYMVLKDSADVQIWTADNVGGADVATLATLAASGGSALVGYLPSGTGSVATTLQAKCREQISIFDKMTAAQMADVQSRTASIDISAAFQAAIDHFGSGDGEIILPAGKYKMVTGVTVAKDRIHIRGAGLSATMLDFEPTANGTCIKVDKGSTVAYQGSIKDIGFMSNDTTYTKTAIQVLDASGYCVENCGTVYPHWLGNNSIFLKIEGREAGSYSNIYAQTNRPLVIGPIASPHTPSGISIDHHNFHNLYLISVGNPVVEILTGVLLTQVSFTGYQAWVGGTYGLYWNDTTSAAASNGLTIENVRFEQTSDATKYLYYIVHNYELQGFTVRNGQGSDRNGFYLRKCSNVLIDSFEYGNGSGEAVNIDATVKDFGCINTFYQAGSTATITGHDLVFATPKQPNTGALAPTAFYCLSSNGARMNVGRTYTGTATRNSFTEVLGGGTITSTYRYTLIGNQCFFRIEIVCAGGATIACIANTSYISGLPTAAYSSGCDTVRSDNTSSLGIGMCATTAILPAAWSAVANASYIISGNYEIA